MGYSTGVPGCAGSAAGDWLGEGLGAGAAAADGVGVGVADPGRFRVGRCAGSDGGDDCAAAVAARNSSGTNGNEFRMKSVRKSEKVLLTLYPEDRIFREKGGKLPRPCPGANLKPS